jgi:hypothetical protein
VVAEPTTEEDARRLAVFRLCEAAPRGSRPGAAPPARASRQAHLARLAAFVNQNLACARDHMQFEGVPADRADAIARASLDAFLGGEARLEAAVGPRPDAALGAMVGRQEALRGRGVTPHVGHLRDLVAGWSEADWLRYHGWLWHQNLERGELAACVRAGLPEDYVRGVVREAAALGALRGEDFAKAAGKLIEDAAAA